MSLLLCEHVYFSFIQSLIDSSFRMSGFVYVLSVLDSKGFFRMKCSEFCVIEYHSVCWQQFKQSLSFKTDIPLKVLCIFLSLHNAVI